MQMVIDIRKSTQREIILNLVAKRRQIIYGQQATNFHINSNLRKDTKDFDILSKKPKESAEELADKLNKNYSNQYEVIPAAHPDTYRVKDIKTKETIADYTKSTKRPKNYNELGVRYVNLDYAKKKLKESLKNPNSAYRHEKDKDTLDKINNSRSFPW